MISHNSVQFSLIPEGICGSIIAGCQISQRFWVQGTDMSISENRIALNPVIYGNFIKSDWIAMIWRIQHFQIHPWTNIHQWIMTSPQTFRTQTAVVSLMWKFTLTRFKRDVYSISLCGFVWKKATLDESMVYHHVSNISSWPAVGFRKSDCWVFRIPINIPIEWYPHILISMDTYVRIYICLYIYIYICIYIDMYTK